MDHIEDDTLVGRQDGPVSLSKSCSDKLALKQCTSLLSGSTALLISPENAYLDTLILSKRQCLLHAIERALRQTGRMKSTLEERWSDGYSFEPFKGEGTELDFDFSRQSSQCSSEMVKGCSTSAVWTSYFKETLINGVF